MGCRNVAGAVLYLALVVVCGGIMLQFTMKSGVRCIC